MNTTIEGSQLTGVFGSEAVPVPGTSFGAGVKAAQSSGSVVVPFTDAALAGQPGIAGPREARDALALKPDSSVLDAVGAAITQFDTYKLITRAARPHFDGESSINQTEYLDNLSMVLDEDERSYFMKYGKGAQSAAYALEQIKAKRDALSVVGEHEIVGTLMPMLDPLWAVVPPAIKVGRATGAAGRATSALASGGFAASVAAMGEGPHSDAEIGLAFLSNTAIAAMAYTPGKGLVHADKDFPAAKLNAIVDEHINPAGKPKVRMVSPAEFKTEPQKPRAVLRSDGTWEMQPQPDKQVKVRDAVFEEVPKELQPNAVNTDAAAVVKSVESELEKRAGIGQRMMWNMHKTMSSFGPAGKKFADLMYDNNADLSVQSLESHRAIIKTELQGIMFEYEDTLRAAMAEDGHGMLKQVWPGTSRKAAAHQAKIEHELRNELFRREQAEREGGLVIDQNVPERIRTMADQWQRLHDTALDEMKRAGVEGAEQIERRMGYFSRKWSSLHMEDMIGKFKAAGLDDAAAKAKVVQLVSMSVRRGSGMDQALADIVGSAIVNRSLSKGYFEDAIFNSPAGAGQMKQIREILVSSGAPQEAIDRVLTAMRAQTDEAGKVGFLKHRIDLDYKASTRVGSETVRVTDLIDSRMTSIADQYISNTATQVAFAKKGLNKLSAVEDMRTELLHGVPSKQRKQAEQLFDDTINYWKGLPAGVRMNDTMRNAQQFTRLVSLPWGGLWQATEFATTFAEFGMLKTLKYASKQMPGFKELLGSAGKDAESARSLHNILTNHSNANLRLRPYLHRFEDGYELDAGSVAQLSMQQAGQLVPYANGMKYVHSAQANLVANLIIDRLQMAASGNAKAAAALQKYGLESQVMNKLKIAMDKHGLNVDSWDDALWDQVRPAFGKMMDESVLHARLGDMPAFAMFDPVGKFIFTYRSFVLTAHNKVLGGGLERNGAGAVGLMLMYQLPLTMLAVQAQSGIKGTGTLSDKDMITHAIGQMGGLGLLTEPFKWATGQSNAVGSPALMAVDRGIKTGQAAIHGEGAKFTSSAMTLLPVAASAPWFRALSERTKE